MTTEQRIIAIITDQFSIHQDFVTTEKHFDNDLGADSLDAVELVMSLEEEFDIEISDNQAENIETVQDMIDCVEGLI